MSDLKLSLPERALLLVLMAENGELTNKQIAEKHAPSLQLTGKSRLKLVDAKLIECRKVKQAFHFVLAEGGWHWGREELTREAPKGAGSVGAALYAVLRGLGRYLDRTGHSLAHVISDQVDGEAGAGEKAGSLPADEIERRVRRAYRELSDPAGSWVGLADLRDHLGGIARAELDGVLRLMARMPSVRVEEETNQKALTGRDRAAAVVVGNRDQHVLQIEEM